MCMPIHQSGQVAGPVIFLEVWETQTPQSFRENKSVPANTRSFGGPHKGSGEQFIVHVCLQPWAPCGPATDILAIKEVIS